MYRKGKKSNLGGLNKWRETFSFVKMQGGWLGVGALGVGARQQIMSSEQRCLNIL